MINMQEEQNQIGTKQTKVELQIIPDEAKVELFFPSLVMDQN